MNEKIGQTIKNLRQQKGWTQAELGEKIGYSLQAVSAWERGQNRPDIQAIPVLCKIFEITSDQLLGIEPEQSYPDTIGANESTLPPSDNNVKNESPKVKEKTHSLMLKIMIFAYFITTGIIILLSTINMAFILNKSTNYTFYNFVLRIRDLPMLLATTIFIALFVTKKKGNDILFWIALGLYAASLSCTVIANNYAHIVGLIRNVNPFSGVLPAKTQLIISYFDVAFTVATYALLPLAFAHKNENAVGVWAKLKNSVLYYVVLALLIISVVVLYTTTAVSVVFVMQTLLFAIPVALTYLLFRLTKDNETTFFSKNPDDKNAPVLSQRILIQILLSCILLMLLTGNIVYPLLILADSYTATFAFITFTLIPIACVVCYFVFTSGNAKLRIALCAVYVIAGIYLGTLLVNPLTYYSPYFSNNPWIYVSFYVVLGAISVAQLFTMHDKQALPKKQLLIAKICLTAAEVLFVALAVTLTFVHETYDQQIIPIFTYLQLIFFILNCVIKQPWIKSTPVVDVAVSVNAPVVVGTDVDVAVAVNATTNVDADVEVDVNAMTEQPSYKHTRTSSILLRTIICIFGAISFLIAILYTARTLIPRYTASAQSLVHYGSYALLVINAIILLHFFLLKKKRSPLFFWISASLLISTCFFFPACIIEGIMHLIAYRINMLTNSLFIITVVLDIAIMFFLPLSFMQNNGNAPTLKNHVKNSAVYYVILIVSVTVLSVSLILKTPVFTLLIYIYPTLSVLYLLLFERTQDKIKPNKNANTVENQTDDLTIKKSVLSTILSFSILLVAFLVTLIHNQTYVYPYYTFAHVHFITILIFTTLIPIISIICFFVFIGGNAKLRVTLGIIFTALIAPLCIAHFQKILHIKLTGVFINYTGIAIYFIGIFTVILTTTLPDKKWLPKPITITAKSVLITAESLALPQMVWYCGLALSQTVLVLTLWHIAYFAILCIIKQPWLKASKNKKQKDQ